MYTALISVARGNVLLAMGAAQMAGTLLYGPLDRLVQAAQGHRLRRRAAEHRRARGARRGAAPRRGDGDRGPLFVQPRRFR